MRIEEAIAEVRKGKYLTWNGQILKPSNAISISTMLKSYTFGVEEPLAKEWVEIWNGDKPKQPAKDPHYSEAANWAGPESPEQGLSVAQAAQVLNVPESTLYAWIYDKKIVAYTSAKKQPGGRKFTLYYHDLRLFARAVNSEKIRTKYDMPKEINGVPV